jgi:glycerol-3-phosphate dehydrogenase
MKRREEAVQAIEGKSFDVCVIGGGATGSGCALDSQLRGLKTVQLEAEDFASGASSASTKMVHGGVRYLQNAILHLDFKEYLVLKEALRERVHMLRNAPFLTNTTSFLVPCFDRLDVAYFSVGLKLYDWIAGRDSLAASTFISREETLRRVPEIASKNLLGAVVYADGQFDDARYNITLVKTFTEAGGETLNHAGVIAFEKDASGRLATAIVEEKVMGRAFPVHARCFVNATGPYADKIRTLATPASRPRIRLSKGVHIVLPAEVLSGREALLIPKTDDGRVLFAIPWLGSVLVGTTDEEINSFDDVHLRADEVDYLLRHLNRYLATPLSAGQIVGGMAGIRPLLTSGKAKNTNKLARSHEVEIDPHSGLVSIMGGKWTTYRAMAQDAIDAAQKKIGMQGSQCRTLNHKLVGSDGYSENYSRSLEKIYGLSVPAARRLAEKYGTRASDVMEPVRGDPQLAQPIGAGQAPLRAEALFAIRDEMAISIEDVLARRLGVQTQSWKAAIEAAQVVADILAQELGWSETVKKEALARYDSKIRGLMQKAGIGTETLESAL